MLLGVLGTNELIIIIFGAITFIIVPICFIYKYAKNKGRLQEMERQAREWERNK
jgi:hypothetical protein